MEPLLLAGFGLRLLGGLFLVFEAFVPSGGFRGLVAFNSTGVGIVLRFKQDSTWGAIGLPTTNGLGPMLLF